MRQAQTLVSGLVDDPPLFTEEHFLLQYFVWFVPLCLLSTRVPHAAQPRRATSAMLGTP